MRRQSLFKRYPSAPITSIALPGLLTPADRSAMTPSQGGGACLENPTHQSWTSPMLAYRARIKPSDDGLEGPSMPQEWRDNDRIILQNNITFMGHCLAKDAHSFYAL